MRSGGVGDGLGEGTGVGDGVCASASSGRFVAAKPAAPRAGSSFTKLRRSTFVLRGFLFFFMVVSFIRGDHRPTADALSARSSVFQLDNFRFTKTVDRNDIEIVVFTFGDDGISLAAQL